MSESAAAALPRFDAPVAVTGASGYLGSWVTKYLLDAGATVHATVRDPSRADKVGHLQGLAAEAPGELRLFAADLLADGSFDAAFAECGTVMHTASPFFIDTKDPQRELLAPAVQGTLNVMKAIETTPSVTRVVLTSSVAAMFGDLADIVERGHPLCAEDWNESSSLEHQPYAFSKTEAEKAAWERCEAQTEAKSRAGGSPRWTMATIHPGFVFGPSLSERVDGTSVETLLRYLGGGFRTGVPDLMWQTVDVRDAAMAHLRAAALAPGEGRERFILAQGTATMLELGALLGKVGSRPYKLPKMTVPKFVMYLMGPLNGLSWKYVSRNVGLHPGVDAGPSRERLGIEYRPFEQTLADHVAQLERDQLV